MRFVRTVRAAGPAALASFSCISNSGCSGADHPSPLSDSSLTLNVSTPVAGATKPVAGAAVALDTADGARQEALTDSDGRATFTNFDGTAGAFSFTVAAPGYIAVSNVGLTQPGVWRVTLQPFGDDPTWMDVAGTVRGKKNVDDFLVASASIPSSTFEGLGPVYAMRVAPHAQFSIVVGEWTYGPASASMSRRGTLFTGWSAFALPPLDSVTNVDLDIPGTPGLATDRAIVGQSLAPATGEGTMVLDPAMAGAQGAIAVSSLGSSGSLYLGGATLVDLEPNGVDLHYRAEWVSPVSDLVTTYSLALQGGRAITSARDKPGGEVTFLRVPTLTASRTMQDAFTVADADPGTTLIMTVERDGQSTAWLIYNQGFSTGEFRIPRLPSGIDPRLVLGTGGASVVAEVCLAEADGHCSKLATARPVALVSAPVTP